MLEGLCAMSWLGPLVVSSAMASFAQLAEPAHASAALMSGQDADKQHGRFAWPGSAKWTEPELCEEIKTAVAESDKGAAGVTRHARRDAPCRNGEPETARTVSAERPSTDGSVPAVQGGSPPGVVEV
ncbi:MAG TPA: hypothetical protein VE597_10170 [Geminicoccaceae bacterium]|nr:hypothetical protein [Geminicoccaceae bacterium]